MTSNTPPGTNQLTPMTRSGPGSVRHRRSFDAAHCTLVVVLAMTAFAYATSTNAQDIVPASQQDAPIALVGGKVFTGTGEVLENSTVLFQDGTITAVGPDVEIPADAKVIDASGQHVYPGLFESHSQIGLIEIGAVDATIDVAEEGDLNPNARANIAVNPDSEIIPVTRANGVLLALTSPSGGLISGQASVLQLDGWTWEDLTLASNVAMVIDWPSVSVPPDLRGSMSEEELAEYIDGRQQQLASLRKFFEQARAWHEANNDTLEIRSAQQSDLRLESMKALLDGEQKLLIRADRLAEIECAVAFAVEQRVKPVILGGYDAPRCAPLLTEHDVPVIVPAVYRLPLRRDDAFDMAYDLPLRLKQAGIRFAISGTDRSETWNARILPDHAATAIAYGLDRETALRAITLTPAEIFGVAEQVGSIEKGKHATLFVCSGDVFEIKSNVTHAFVQGRKIDLRSRHTRLYEKYRQKYGQPEN